MRRPPRSTLDRSSAASDVYKRQVVEGDAVGGVDSNDAAGDGGEDVVQQLLELRHRAEPVSYTHLTLPTSDLV